MTRPAACERGDGARPAHGYGVAVCSPDGGDRLRVERLVEKPPPGRAPSNLAILGRYVVTPEVLAALGRRSLSRGPGAELQLTDAFADLLASSSPVLAIPFQGGLFDSGTPADHTAAAARYVERSHPASKLTAVRDLTVSSGPAIEYGLAGVAGIRCMDLGVTDALTALFFSPVRPGERP